MPKDFVLSVDIGQMTDYTAVGVLQIMPLGIYDLTTLKRLKLRTPYPEVVRIIKETFDELVKEAAGGKVTLIIDVTGVGRPVLDMLRAAKLNPLAVTITGGNVVSHEGMEYHVPKRDLVAACQVLSQRRRLNVSQGVAAMQEFVQELENFKYKISIATGHDTYEAWRESIHDDIVLCVCLGCWAASRGQRPFVAVAGGDNGRLSVREGYEANVGKFNRPENERNNKIY